MYSIKLRSIGQSVHYEICDDERKLKTVIFIYDSETTRFVFVNEIQYLPRAPQMTRAKPLTNAHCIHTNKGRKPAGDQHVR